MRGLRNWAIAVAGATLIVGMPLASAQACDDDRYPCPPRAQPAVQEEAPAQAAPAAQPKKKVSRPRASETASVKPPAAARAKPKKPAVPEQTAAPIAPTAAQALPVAEAAPAALPASGVEQALDAQSRGESLVATAGTAWPVSPKTDDAGAAPAPAVASAEDAAPNAVQLVNANEVNELDRAAESAQSSWLSYLWLILGAVITAAAVMGLFSTLKWLFARRGANPRMRARRA